MTDTLKTLVLGGGGFMGSHLCASLVQRGHYVAALSKTGRFKHPHDLPDNWQSQIDLLTGDIQDYDLIVRLLSQADVVFYKVASVGVQSSAHSIRNFVQTNIGGMAGFVEALRNAKHNIKKIILDSSMSVYGEGIASCSNCGTVHPDLRYGDAPEHWDPFCPMCGGTISPLLTPEATERKGESVYAITKKTQEDLLAATCKTLNIPLIVLRYGSVLGPAASEANPCAALMREIWHDRQPKITEDGLQTRDFVFVNDAVRASLLALDAEFDGVSYFNIGSGKSISMLAFARQLCSALSEVMRRDKIEPAVTGSFRAGDVRHCAADCSRAAKQLGFIATTSMSEGLHTMGHAFMHASDIILCALAK